MAMVLVMDMLVLGTEQVMDMATILTMDMGPAMDLIIPTVLMEATDTDTQVFYTKSLHNELNSKENFILTTELMILLNKLNLNTISSLENCYNK